MSDKKRTPRERRVVVGLGTIEQADRMLDAAVDLAATLRAELHGLFIEDPGMLDAAALPFTRVVTAHAQVRKFERTPLRNRTRSDNAAFKRAVSLRARQAQLSWSVSRKRGEPLEEIQRQSRQGDIVVFRTRPPPSPCAGFWRRQRKLRKTSAALWSRRWGARRMSVPWSCWTTATMPAPMR